MSICALFPSHVPVSHAGDHGILRLSHAGHAGIAMGSQGSLAALAGGVRARTLQYSEYPGRREICMGLICEWHDKSYDFEGPHVAIS